MPNYWSGINQDDADEILRQREQPNAAVQVGRANTEQGTGEPGSLAPAAPESETPGSIHDRIVAAVTQAGHPDWSLREMVDTLRAIAIDARSLERRLRAKLNEENR